MTSTHPSAAASARIHTLFDQRLASAPQEVFLYAPEREWTFADLGTLVDALAREMQAHGVVEGDRVLIVAENCPEHVALILGIAK